MALGHLRHGHIQVARIAIVIGEGKSGLVPVPRNHLQSGGLTGTRLRQAKEKQKNQGRPPDWNNWFSKPFYSFSHEASSAYIRLARFLRVYHSPLRRLKTSLRTICPNLCFSC